MIGWSKIKGCCEQAANDGWRYVWVDSCCIDKTSSSELSEAINSMYQWYEKSQMCYVYLSDVTAVPTGRNGDTHHRKNSAFRRSKWFTRGWTLQELIAPKTVIFYNRSWREIGTRRCLETLISDITGIRSEHFLDPRDASVAQRMSWASRRETTRVEDHAYSLLGLFNVSMPPLYGEGWKAFRRLQLEILANSDDESIFAWNSDHKYSVNIWRRRGGLLALFPADFTGSGDIVRSESDNRRRPYYMTNRGLCIEVFLLSAKGKSSRNIYVVPLHCVRQNVDGCIGVVISYSILRAEAARDMFQRTDDDLVLVKEQERPSQRTVIYVRQSETQVRESFSYHDWQAQTSGTTFVLATDSLLQSNFTVFREIWHNCPHPPIPVRCISDYGENNQRRIGIHQGCYIVYLYFVSKAYIEGGLMKVPPEKDSEELDSFAVVLEMIGFDTAFYVDIIIPQASQSREADVEASLAALVDFRRRTDRISRAMRSGRSVSAALRRKPELEKFPVYVLDITIDPEGNLPWPDLS